MRASDLVKTDSDRMAAADGLARTELADAVNTGIVGRADKSASVLLDGHGSLARPHMGVAEDVAHPPLAGGQRSAAYSGGTAYTADPSFQTGTYASGGAVGGIPADTGSAGSPASSSSSSGHSPTGAAALGRSAVNHALQGTELEGVDTLAYTAYAGSKAAKRAVQKFSAKRAARAAARNAGASAEGIASPVSAREASAGQSVLKSAGRGAEDAVSGTLRGTELDGAVEIERGARLGFRATRYLGRRAGGAAANIQSRMQARRHQMKAVMERAAAKKAAASTGAKAAGAKAAGSAAAGTATSTAASGGGGGAVAAAGGVGCLPIVIVFLLILLIPLFIGVIGGVNSLEEDAGALSGNEAVVAEYLLDKGLDEVQVAAIIGNMVQESGVNPAAVNRSSGAYGLCQWLGGRQDALFALCDERGVPHSDINAQLDFFWEEFTMARSGGWSNRSRYNDFMACVEDSQLETAVTIFARYFERCGEGEMNLPHRLSEAQRVLDAMRTGGGAVASIGDLQWPSDTPSWGTYAGHFGLDIQAAYGTPIYAPADGTVIWAGWSWESTYGNIVRIYHEELGLQTACAHMSRVAVSKGQTVKKGQVIGYVGSTGNSSGPHIHFEIYEKNSPSISGYPIMDDMNKWGKYFDAAALSANRVW